MDPETIDFASTKFGQSFVSIFQKAAEANGMGNLTAADFAPVQAPVAEPVAAPVEEAPVEAAPEKKAESIFDDTDDDDSDILPVFKGRNIFGNN
jgi:hypothetical protein